MDGGPPELLARILSTRRRHGSQGDRDFRMWLFNYIKSKLSLTPVLCAEGVIKVSINDKSTVLFSCHVDTVHGHQESESGKPQKLLYDPNFSHLYLAKDSGSGCLGGDDGVGIYIMLEMLRRKIEGHYVFHTGEECGGIGARAFVKSNGLWLRENIEQVVAFDRAVQDDANPEVIITQGGRACASERYGKALAEALNKVPFEKPYITSTRGAFTDSKLYADDVPECVNLGCFYSKQHTPSEVVDCFGVELLLEAACKVDWKNLPIERTAAPEQSGHRGNNVYGDYGGYNGYGGGNGGYGGGARAPAPSPAPSPAPAPKPKAQQQKALTSLKRKSLLDELADMSLEDLDAFVMDEPGTAARALAMLLAKSRGQESSLELLYDMLGASS